METPRIGLALGSGSARGWAHIGIIQALGREGIEPEIICGSSIGALVAGSYAAGHLNELAEWVRSLHFLDLVKLMDIRLAGGVIEGRSLMTLIEKQLHGVSIEELSIPFGAVATELQSGREVWLRSGSLSDAIRASIALPALFSPVRYEGRWLVDGGLTNPVPVSLCRAMGAEVIIAVNLNSNIVGKHLAIEEQDVMEADAMEDESDDLGKRDLLDQLLKRFNGGAALELLRRKASVNTPGLLEVAATAINIMQDRITRSRMAGDPPDLLLTPHLSHLGLLEFDRASEAIEEGERCVERFLPLLHECCRR